MPFGLGRNPSVRIRWQRNTRELVPKGERAKIIFFFSIYKKQNFTKTFHSPVIYNNVYIFTMYKFGFGIRIYTVIFKKIRFLCS